MWLIAVLMFFRDPARITPPGDNLIIAPADGKVIDIVSVNENSANSSGKRLSIFMSPLNVHVNRSPVKGTIQEVKHKSGRFYSAFKPQAVKQNERTVVTIDTPFGIVELNQVAGFLARRIVFHPRAGDSIHAGERIGMIRFGSRVDLQIPKNASISLQLGQKVRAGETIVGEFENE